MSDSIRLYFRYVGVSLRGQMQYRASFIMLTLGMLAVTGMEILGIWALFRRFGSIKGWGLPDIALFYGIINVAFALAEGVGRGFDAFSNLVKSGDFDRLLLRPRSTALQVAAQDVQLMRVGRLIQGLAVLLWAGASLHVPWTVGRVALTVFAILGGTCLFYGLFVLQATLAFWSTETLELFNTVTYGGTEAGQYPLAIYRPWFRGFFTFVVPLACVTYFPALAILDRPDQIAGSPRWFQWSSPLLGVAFLAVALKVWKIGERHYRSTGS